MSIPTQGARGELIAPRCAPESEIDPPRIKRGKGAELLRDHERRVVREHDPAGADADAFSASSDVTDQDRGRGARDPRHVVMFRHPEAVETERFCVLGEI